MSQLVTYNEHLFSVEGIDTSSHRGFISVSGCASSRVLIPIQSGPVELVGENGVTAQQLRQIANTIDPPPPAVEESVKKQKK